MAIIRKASVSSALSVSELKSLTRTNYLNFLGSEGGLTSILALLPTDAQGHEKAEEVAARTINLIASSLGVKGGLYELTEEEGE
jgi:hypothetical protein